MRIAVDRIYCDMSDLAAIPEGCRRLAAVVREAGDIVRIADAERALDVSRASAAKLLSRWRGQGWLRRVGPGAYAPVSLESLASEQVLEDPWVLVPALYDPAYIGGRTAAEHWDLTEQIFNNIVVMTARPVRAGSQQHHGARFTLRRVRAGHDVRDQERLARQDQDRRVGCSSHHRRHAGQSRVGGRHPACR